MAMPAAEVTACCSAMPTSRHRSGKRSAKGSSPVESGMAAVIATTSGRSSASLMSVGERLGVGARLHAAHVVHVLDGVLLGGQMPLPCG